MPHPYDGGHRKACFALCVPGPLEHWRILAPLGQAGQSCLHVLAVPAGRPSNNANCRWRDIRRARIAPRPRDKICGTL